MTDSKVDKASKSSDIEHKIKEAAAAGEPQWANAGTQVGLQVWRIEQFKVVPWPASMYGQFHAGDSYIVLSTYKPKPESPALAWDVHFWIGSESTQDEYGTAAYKTVELDTHLKRKAVQHREIQGHETRKFVRYFKGKVTYLKGGVASGFKHVEAQVREPVLLRLKGRGDRVALTQMELRRSAMNSGDVFILDCEEGIFQWNGAESNGYEKARAAEVCSAMREQRSKCAFAVYEEGSPRALDPSLPFATHLPVDEVAELGGQSAGVQAATAEVEDAQIQGFKTSLFALELDATKRGQIGIAPVAAQKKLPRELLRSDGVFLVDTGFQLFLWVGAAADFAHRISAFVFAQAYLKQFKRPAVLPLTRFVEGHESDKFWWHFARPVGYRIDAKPDPDRLHPLMRQAPRQAGNTLSTAPSPAPPPGVPPAVPATAAPSPAEAVTAPPAIALDIVDDDTQVVDADIPDEDDGPPPPRWQDIPARDKLRCIDGTCYPVVSDAWGCCLTSCGCSWSDRVACLGIDMKGLYSPCVQIEAMCLKPAFDKAHPGVFCVLFQGYTYVVVPEPRLCKGSQQAMCVQNRCSLPCDDEVPSTCTCCGYQRCQRSVKTGDTLELVPFLPYPEGEAGSDAPRIDRHTDLTGLPLRAVATQFASWTRT